ncbi:hypothetical protein E5D57_011551 [Metarhizium anisopliae]|nr:hypothetical protein E5D57_011551 [Metarhizium anisopliae]
MAFQQYRTEGQYMTARETLGAQEPVAAGYGCHSAGSDDEDVPTSQSQNVVMAEGRYAASE